MVQQPAASVCLHLTAAVAAVAAAVAVAAELGLAGQAVRAAGASAIEARQWVQVVAAEAAVGDGLVARLVAANVAEKSCRGWLWRSGAEREQASWRWMFVVRRQPPTLEHAAHGSQKSSMHQVQGFQGHPWLCCQQSTDQELNLALRLKLCERQTFLAWDGVSGRSCAVDVGSRAERKIRLPRTKGRSHRRRESSPRKRQGAAAAGLVMCPAPSVGPLPPLVKSASSKAGKHTQR